MDSKAERGLFPPSAFVPTAIVWGLWTAGLMAAVNLARQGYRSRARNAIVFTVIAQAAVWAGLGLLWRRVGGPAGHITLIKGTPDMPWFEFRLPWSSVWVVQGAVNGVAGYIARRAQQRAYDQWATLHPPGTTRSPFLAWWVILLAIAGALVVCALVFRVFFW